LFVLRFRDERKKARLGIDALNMPALCQAKLRALDSVRRGTLHRDPFTAMIDIPGRQSSSGPEHPGYASRQFFGIRVSAAAMSRHHMRLDDVFPVSMPSSADVPLCGRISYKPSQNTLPGDMMSQCIRLNKGVKAAFGAVFLARPMAKEAGKSQRPCWLERPKAVRKGLDRLPFMRAISR